MSRSHGWTLWAPNAKKFGRIGACLAVLALSVGGMQYGWAAETPGFVKTKAYKELGSHAQQWKSLLGSEKLHLRKLLQNPNRFHQFSLKGGGLFLDVSRQRVTRETVELLHGLAQERNVVGMFKAMTEGAMVNPTEKRAALHTACRLPKGSTVMLDGKNVARELYGVNQQIKHFAEKVRSGELRGTTGKTFNEIRVVAIGGSYLGPEYVSEGLGDLPGEHLRVGYVANVDPTDLGRLEKDIEQGKSDPEREQGKSDPERTLWVVTSKSYTTAETLLNATTAIERMLKKRGLKEKDHVVTVTAENSPGDLNDGTKLQSFHMFDFVGGRYSVTSAVGGVPISLQYGHEVFQRFLNGAHEMDLNALNPNPAQNLPLTAALMDIWNNNFLDYNTTAIIPYAEALTKLAPHIQQVAMESNGKHVDLAGNPVPFRTGQVIFGEPGTKSQHSFFQQLHQGQVTPVEFIGVLNSAYPHITTKRKGVTNHQELLANFIAQPNALANGSPNLEEPHKHFEGNRPSSVMLMKDLSPENIGRLLAFYEAKIAYQSFIWGTPAFDQEGVQLGKKLATKNREAFAAHNEGKRRPAGIDPNAARYINAVISGEFPK